MKKRIFLWILFFAFFSQIRADGGMWMPHQLQKREVDMQSKGLQISTNEIYSETQPSLKDAIVKFGSGCTGEFISKDGLLVTNHHCGYAQIQAHSTVEKNYLQHGFWAMNRSEELPCEGLKISMVIKTIEVTEAVISRTNPEMSEADAIKIRAENMAQLIADAETETGYKAEIYPVFNGHQYWMYLNEVFEDVRLVGAPPSNIGKFGGDTDNWMWPRHTGDFALFRVYANADNKPAKYAPNNVPYQPRRHFKLSLKGVEKDDFTFVFGYPARTSEYLTSYAIRLKTEVENPIAIDARSKRLNIIKTAMNQDALTRIQYSAKAANIANAWKKWQGENRGIRRINGIQQKETYEKTFQEWANIYNNGQYKDLLPQLEKAYMDLEPFIMQQVIFNEHVLAPEIVRFAYTFEKLITLAEDKNVSTADFDELLKTLKTRVAPFFKDFNADVDQQIFKSLSIIDMDGFEMRFVDFPDKNFDDYVDEMYAKSIFTQEEKLHAALKRLKRSNALKILGKDPLLNYANQVYSMYFSMIAPTLKAQNETISLLQRTYMKAQMEMNVEQDFYPDANFTLRVTYGKVNGYKPSDGITYNYYSTLSGLIAKEDSNIFDYVVEDKLKKLYNDKDFGQYANARGEMPIAFIATNHTTGGNSGSPVLNGKGEMIGINFDRCWEGTMSDLMYDPAQCRNISLDVRFMLFIMDKFANAQHLLREICGDCET